MDYAMLADTYELLTKTTKRLEKTEILRELLHETANADMEEVSLLIHGKVFPVWSDQKIGVASQYILKAIVIASGKNIDDIERIWKKTGDLGTVAEQAMYKKRQTTLFSQKLTVKKVFMNLRKLATIDGVGSVDKKLQLIVELLASATPMEAKYIVRTILEDLRVGTGKGTIRDAIAWSCFPKFIQLFDKKDDEKTYIQSKTAGTIETIEAIDTMKKKKYICFPSELIAREMYNKLLAAIDHAFHMTNDFAAVIIIAREEGYKGLMNVDIEPFRPVQVMLYKKAEDIKDAFKQVGKPAALEYKYDGFRIECHKKKDKIQLYTRNFEDVTKQFPDVVEAVKKYVLCDSCIFDSEVVGYNRKTAQYLPFQKISQRIRRKHNIAETAKEFPVEINVFDILYYNEKSVIDKPFHERRKLLSKIIHCMDRVIILSKLKITDNEEEAQRFYNESLDKGNEGIMMKNLEAVYKPGSRVGFGVKVKPVMESLDLVIVCAEWGEGRRAAWLTSFTVACRDEENAFLTIGKVSTGLKELEEEGTTFHDMTKLLKSSIVEEHGKEVRVKPNVIIEVHYEEIQKSPKYTSGYALRFPRFIRLREDRSPNNCTQIGQIEELFKEQKKT